MSTDKRIKSFRIGETGRFAAEYRAKNDEYSEQLELNKTGEDVLILNTDDIALLRAILRHIDLGKVDE